jgi:hypothetical protein
MKNRFGISLTTFFSKIPTGYLLGGDLMIGSFYTLSGRVNVWIKVKLLNKRMKSNLLD